MLKIVIKRKEGQEMIKIVNSSTKIKKLIQNPVFDSDSFMLNKPLYLRLIIA